MQVTGDDAHHLTRVLRAKVGERLSVRSSDGRLAVAEIAGFGAGCVNLRFVEEEETGERQGERTLLIALLKGDKLDLVMQKATELGITRIFPVETAHSVVRYDDAKALKKREKWQKIAVEAAKQCGRKTIPTVEEIRPLGRALRALEASALRLFFYEAEEDASVKNILRRAAESDAGRGDIALLIGPEGGFSIDEATHIEAAGFTAVTFGRSILRAETAAIAACAVVQYESL